MGSRFSARLYAIGTDPRVARQPDHDCPDGDGDGGVSRATFTGSLGIDRSDIQLFHEGIERPNLELQVQEVWDEDGQTDSRWRARFDQTDYAGGSVIVYFSLIKTLQRFSDHLLADRYRSCLLSRRPAA